MTSGGAAAPGGAAGGPRAERALVVRAHAKINLSLRVLGRRPDGYHELKTIFQTLALHDTIRLAPAPGPLTITCTDRAVPCDRRNLVHRAAELLWQAAGRPGEPEGVSVAIRKRIPAQGGLGGGSADGAAALAGLAAFWGLALPGPVLADLAKALGADVPFFLVGGTALGLGRGDDIHPLDEGERRWVTLALPAFGVSTPEAFGWLDEDRGEGVGAPGELAADLGRNDLEGPVVRRHPEVGALVAALREAGAEVAAMSGSGSTVFGLFGAPGAARAARLRLARGGVRSLVTETLSRARHAASVGPDRA